MLLYCDLETFNETPISYGSHRYAETAEVLLWGYAIDDKPARVWDLTSQKTMPEDLRCALEAIIDRGEGHTIWHNGLMFDTIVLKHAMGIDIPANRVFDTMLMAYQHSLPGSLAQLSEVFRMSKDVAKDKDGKRLVQLFCKPLPATRKIKRATKQTHPEDWGRFINYCRLDVEAERELFKKLPRFNFTRKEFMYQCLDAKINRRGMLMDVDLAKAAVACAQSTKGELDKRVKDLTNGSLDAATQRDKLIAFIKEEFGWDVPSMTKAEIEKRIQDPSIPEPMRELLALRLMSTRTSVKKFEAVLNCVSKDNRLRGCLQFRGAARTGRFCLTGDHEVLTPSGWIRLDDWQGGRIAVWNKASETISFQEAQSLAFDYEGEMYRYESARCSQVSTPDHRMAYLDKSGRWAVATVEHLASLSRPTIPYTGVRKAPATCEHDLLRVLIMTQADGRYSEDGQVIFNFKKIRKVQRCKMLLRRVGIPFVVDQYDNGNTRIAIYSRDVPMWLRLFKGKEFGYWLLNESADIIFDELPEWDGYRCGPNSIQYCTKSKHNADLVQALAVLSGRTATQLTKKPQKAEWSDCFVVNIWNTPGKGHVLRDRPSVEFFKGTVYCASTTTGFFLVRRNGKVWVTGNSGRLYQPQNLPRPSMEAEEIEEAIQLAKMGVIDVFYEDVNTVLANCLRGEIVAPKGKKLVVADYSNVEGRVLAWLASEQWKINAFRDFDAGHGHDLYKLTYGRTFNVKPDEVTKDQRQMGKVLELAMGYQGGAGAFVTFAKGYGIDLDAMAKTVQATIAPKYWLSAENSFSYFKEKGSTHGLKRNTFIACDAVKRAWRDANNEIASLWSKADSAIVDAMTSPKRFPIGKHCTVERKGTWLLIRLPSGRYLCYPAAKLHDDGTCTFSYMGVNQYTRKWERIKTYGGKVIENITQATSCDLLLEALTQLERAGYQTVLTVHDEAITEAPDSEEYNEQSMIRIMTQLPHWAEGLPIAAAGYSAYRYKKD